MITVLTGPDGGLIVRMQNDVTGEVMADLLTRDAAEALIEQARAILRCAPLDPHAGAVASLEVWKARRAGRTCCDCTAGETAGPASASCASGPT